MQMARLTSWQSNHSKILLHNDLTLTSKLNVRSHLILYEGLSSPRKASLLNITLTKYFSHKCGHRTKKKNKKNPKTKKLGVCSRQTPQKASGTI